MKNFYTRRLPRRISLGEQDSQPPQLSKYDGSRIALVIEKGERRTVFRGVGRFVQDDALGNALCISLPNELGSPEFFITEQDWDGQIIPDFEYGCQFCIIMRQ